VDADNIRAARHLLVIRKEMVEILHAFGQGLSEASPGDAKTWILKDQLSALSKSQNFFVPGVLSSERGYQDIQFLTEDERVAQAVNSDLYSRYRQSFIEIYQNRPTFKAPVVRIKTAHGASTAAIYPRYVRTYVEFTAKREDMHKKGGLVLPPPIPDDYETPGRPDASTEE
jgi:hypothetical protein